MRHPKCAGPKCRRVATESGLCHAHRVQRDRGGHLKPLRKRRRNVEAKHEPEVRLFVFADDDDDDDDLMSERRLIRLMQS